MLVDYATARKALLERYDALAKEAGIEAELERVGRITEPSYFDDQHLPPLFTQARREARKQQDADNFRYYRERLREVIFKVADLELRKQIIKAEREFYDFKVNSFMADLV
jgi:hypothetical protein